MGKRLDYRPEKVEEVEPPFVQLARALLQSDAWRKQSVNCRKLMDFLMCEHMNHGGLENGFLYCTYDQLQAWGIGRRLIHPTITEAEKRGLIEVHRGGRKGFAQTHLSRYRITFLKSKALDEQGRAYYKASTNEWKQYREAASEGANDGYEGELSQFTKVNSYSSRRGTLEVPETAEICAAATVHESEPLIYLGPQHSRDDSAPTAPATTEQPEPVEPPKPRKRPDADDSGMVDIEELLGSRPAAPSPQEVLRAHTEAYLASNPPRGKQGLAERIGISRPRLSNWLAGRDPTLSHGPMVALRAFLDAHLRQDDAA